ncbi:hypothetical protein GCM10009409_34430 [Shewanella saliphila]|uniref:Uncharacterized protein n=1 Tax=Shewanella saliphila TaxID=2282698 RepID=A0ABQ2QBT6_9GAMM|nr:hypothetical protein GCM10009409_34430 [Shewanella saliphila]
MLRRGCFELTDPRCRFKYEKSAEYKLGTLLSFIFLGYAEYSKGSILPKTDAYLTVKKSVEKNCFDPSLAV